VSEDNQWRQLGSIANAVLLETRTKAIRRGAVSKPAPGPSLRQASRPAGGFANRRTGNGFLSESNPQGLTPAQLELPFGIEPASQADSGAARSSRGIRLM
jgi:hypothetical protein